MKLFNSAAAGRGPRAHGLDTLRALAISLVFMYHYMVFVSHKPTFGWASVVGWVGVDLFFVLSGYLIANQLLAGTSDGRRLSLGAFYARRALRTLPVFWLVLALYFLFPAELGGKTPPPLWRFLSFTQNLGLQPGTAFSHAWSLCIEEQFYLVLPLLVVISAAFGNRRGYAWSVLLGLLAVGIVARSLLWEHYGRESGGHIDGYYPNIYYATLCRFDEFLPGVAIAMLKHWHRPLWAWLMQRGRQLMLIGSMATLGMLYLVYNYYAIDDGYGYFMTAYGYSLVAMAFAVLVLAALSPHSWLYRVQIPGAYALAIGSYSVYLSHKPVAFWVQKQLAPYALTPALTLLAVVLACAIAGWVLYRFVELPCLALRDRYFPSNFPAEQGALRVAPQAG